MRTTVRLNEDLMEEVRRHARERGVTVTAVLDQALRELLVRHRQPLQGRRIKLPTFRGQGMQPGVDLDDSAALLELMEAPDAANGC